MLGLTDQSSFDEVAHAILRECRRRGYPRWSCIACLSTAIQESTLRMIWSRNRLWYGYYQQDVSYPNRMNPNQNVLEFLNRLDVKLASDGASDDIFKNIFWLQQAPGRKTADDAYHLGRKPYYEEIRRHIDRATNIYDRLFDGELLIPGVEELYV